jgi:pimeloyl-ACP methyl ester carboxylesterase
MLRSSFWSTGAAITAAAGTGSPDPCNLIFMFWLLTFAATGIPTGQKGGSYSLTEYVYNLSCLMRHTGARQVAIVGHSMGGNTPESTNRIAFLAKSL